MRKKIILLGEGSQFIMNTVAANLKKQNFQVVSAGNQLETLRQQKDTTDMAALFLSAALAENPEVIALLKEFFEVKGKVLLLIGSAGDIARCAEQLPANAVVERFVKPLDLKGFILRVEELTSDPTLRRTGQILLVDDDGDYLKLVSGWLSKQYKVAAVSSGMQAITYLANNRPDLILLDYAMPVTSGPQVLEMIRSEPRTAQIPVIFLTGKDDKESVMKVLELGTRGYILKSIEKRELLERIDAFFAGLE